MIIAKKIIIDVTEGEYQTIKYHVIEVKDIDEEKIKNFILFKGLADDDPESGYYTYGIFQDFNDILGFHVENFIKGIEGLKCMEEIDEDLDNDYPNSEIDYWIKQLTKYKDYTFHFEEDKK